MRVNVHRTDVMNSLGCDREKRCAAVGRNVKIIAQQQREKREGIVKSLEQDDFAKIHQNTCTVL
jgi:hypothetical protein